MTSIPTGPKPQWAIEVHETQRLLLREFGSRSPLPWVSFVDRGIVFVVAQTDYTSSPAQYVAIGPNGSTALPAGIDPFPPPEPDDRQVSDAEWDGWWSAHEQWTATHRPALIAFLHSANI